MASPRFPLAFSLVLGRELRLWAKAGHTPVIWWRDDDARAPTEALERLLDLSSRCRAPVTLAAIAGPDLAALARRVNGAPDVELAVHGFRHVNRQPPGQGFGEIRAEDDVAWAREQLRETLAAFHGAGVEPTLFVPPWNNLAPQLLEALAGSPLRAVSGFDQVRGNCQGVERLDTHLDILRWKGGGRFRGSWRFLSRMRRLLAQRRAAARWDEPLGLLTHHLDHDQATWIFLERFLRAFTVRKRHDLMSRTSGDTAALSA